MIVFACHHTGGDLIDRAVHGARTHMPDEPVLVVDSASPDRSYMTRIDAEVADVGNRNYATGAYRWALENTEDEFFYLFHDGLLIHDDLADLKSVPVTAVRWFQTPPTGWGYDQHGQPLNVWARDHYQGKWVRRFQGLFGPMLACRREVLEDLAELVPVLAVDKWQECALERLWGMALNELGFDLSGALQGEMRGFHDPYPSSRVEKIHADRF